MVLILLAGVMFPLWPPSLRLGVYYLSLGVLGLIGVFIGIAVIRLILWVGTSLVMKRGIWWFPNLFEDVGFVSPPMPTRILSRVLTTTTTNIGRGAIQVDSFIPFWAWDEPAPKKSKSKSTSSSSSSGKTKSSKTSSSKGNKEKKSGVAVPVLGSTSGAEGQAVSATSTSTSGLGLELGDEPSAATAPGPKASEGSAMHLGGQENMRQRQRAYVEDAGEDE